ncbi:hypothetical protein Ndes2526B_g03566 [Nannochloris sp. 'desiccata']|nr:hypothetical protein KSW81_001258 [Chlorella desiccata (nom. nud.)]KAH7617618.1 putative DNL-type zinc finger protein [Chlorella desiccata (nom. nud.)]KAH7622728.1 putative DNL-type zinc finger protein [Chlorella desiccata (nom. nud.)]
MQRVPITQRDVWHTPQKGRGAKTSRQIHFKINASQNNHPTPLQLPGGEYWWLGARNDAAIIYGDSFVLQRQKIGGPGLVPASRDVCVEKYSPRPASPPAVSPRMSMELATTLSGMVVIDTCCEEVFEPNTSCTGIVYLGSNDSLLQQAEDVGEAFGKHPRRTRRIRFTCNLCGETNEKEVNPMAWTKGSVFARCNGCEAVHKLKDNLKIFHELKGPVFPPRDMRASFPAVKEILDRIEAKNRLNGQRPFLDN